MTHPDDLAMPFLLMDAFRGLVDTVHADLAEAGFPDVRATHGFAMQAIGEGCTSVELGARLGVTKQAATRTAQTLAGMGLIDRVPDPTDGRARVLVPTQRGRRMLALSAASFRRQLKDWREELGDTAIDTTLSTLAAVDPGRRGPTDLSDWT